MILVVETEAFPSVHKNTSYSLIRVFKVSDGGTSWFENTGRIYITAYQDLAAAVLDMPWLPWKFGTYAEFRGMYVDGKRVHVTELFVEK